MRAVPPRSSSGGEPPQLRSHTSGLPRVGHPLGDHTRSFLCPWDCCDRLCPRGLSQVQCHACCWLHFDSLCFILSCNGLSTKQYIQRRRKKQHGSIKIIIIFILLCIHCLVYVSKKRLIEKTKIKGSKKGKKVCNNILRGLDVFRSHLSKSHLSK